MSYAFDGRGGTWQWLTGDGEGVLQDLKRVRLEIRRDHGIYAEADFMAVISEKLRGAESGSLLFDEDVKVRLHIAPALNEIRWAIELRKMRKWRLYFTEPLNLIKERVMLGLLFAEKVTPDLQDEDIRVADRRYAWWAAQRKG